MRRGCEVLVIVALLALCLWALTPAAAAASIPFEVLDVGPAYVLGPGGGLYPADVTLKLLPFEYEGSIPDGTFLEMLEGAGKYTLANLGVDVLFKTLYADDIAGGVSLPVLNAKAIMPVRAGFCWIGGIGTRPFFRMDLLSGEGGAAATGLAGAPLMLPDRSFNLGFGSDSVTLVYRAAYR